MSAKYPTAKRIHPACLRKTEICDQIMYQFGRAMMNSMTTSDTVIWIVTKEAPTNLAMACHDGCRLQPIMDAITMTTSGAHCRIMNSVASILGVISSPPQNGGVNLPARSALQVAHAGGLMAFLASLWMGRLETGCYIYGGGCEARRMLRNRPIIWVFEHLLNILCVP